MLINLDKNELEEIYKALMYYRYNFENLEKKGSLEKTEFLNKLIDRFAKECIYYN